MTDLARLAIAIETRDVATGVKELDRLTGAAKRAETATDALGAGVGKAGTAITQVGGVSAHTLTNLQFQVNDIATSLISGQSPFVVMTQQGLQMAQVLNGPQGARGALSALGGALAGMINPVNISVFAIAGLSAGIAALWASVSAGRDVEGILERHSELLKSLPEYYQDAAEAARRYVEEARQVTQFNAEQNVQRLQNALRMELDALSSYFQQFEQDNPFAIPVDAATLAVIELVKQAQAGGLSVQELNRQLAAVALDSQASSEARALAEDLLKAAGNATQLANALREAQAVSRETTIGVLSPAANDRVGGAFGVFDERDARNSLISQLGGNKKTGKSEYEREREGVERYLESLRQENELLGLNELARRQREATQRLGNTATQDEIALAHQLIAAKYEQEQSEKALKAAQDARNEAEMFFGQGVLDTLWSAKDGTEALIGSVQRLAESFAYAALQAALLGTGPLAGVFGTANATGGVGGLLGGLFSGMPGFATGGSFTVGGSGGTDSQLVAFRATPGEMVDIKRPGNDNGSGGGPPPIMISIDARGATTDTIPALRAELDSLRRNMPSIVQNAVTQGRRRGSLA